MSFEKTASPALPVHAGMKPDLGYFLHELVHATGFLALFGSPEWDVMTLAEFYFLSLLPALVGVVRCDSHVIGMISSFRHTTSFFIGHPVYASCL